MRRIALYAVKEQLHHLGRHLPCVRKTVADDFTTLATLKAGLQPFGAGLTAVILLYRSLATSGRLTKDKPVSVVPILVGFRSGTRLLGLMFAFFREP